MAKKASKAEKQAALINPDLTENPAAIAEATKQPAETPAAVAAPKEPGKIAQIIDLHKQGKTNKEIEELGFHKTTISIQVTKYLKGQKNEAGVSLWDKQKEAKDLAKAEAEKTKKAAAAEKEAAKAKAGAATPATTEPAATV